MAGTSASAARSEPDASTVHGADYLTEFRLETGLPVWRYEVEGIVLEKSVLLPHEQNTVHVTYRLIAGAAAIRLKLLPSFSFRSHDAPVSTPLPQRFPFTASENRYELSPGPDLPTMRMTLHGDTLPSPMSRRSSPSSSTAWKRAGVTTRKGDLWSPGYFRVDLAQGQDASLVASTETWETIEAISAEAIARAEGERRIRLLAQSRVPAQYPLAGELVLAADQFIIRPAGRPRTRPASAPPARSPHHHRRLSLVHRLGPRHDDQPGRPDPHHRPAVDAGYILRTFAHYIRDGLIPNLFPEGQHEGLYHTADATLWFFHALSRYLAYTADHATLGLLLPKLREIIDHHLRGTRFGIGVDPADGLLSQGAEGYQLTWMDAKVGDWVVTPRRGKAVEINALWYNALRLMQAWTRKRKAKLPPTNWAVGPNWPKRPSTRGSGPRQTAISSTWSTAPAATTRPAVPIRFSPSPWNTPCWIRLLAPVLASFKAAAHAGRAAIAGPRPSGLQTQYDGDLWARDAAYHQGTVWAWLIGPFVDAWIRVHPENPREARRFLDGFEAHLAEACVGTISEIFDAEPPYTPRGCVGKRGA